MRETWWEWATWHSRIDSVTITAITEKFVTVNGRRRKWKSKSGRMIYDNSMGSGGVCRSESEAHQARIDYLSEVVVVAKKRLADSQKELEEAKSMQEKGPVSP